MGNNDDIKFFGTMAVIFTLVVVFAGSLVWTLSPAWTDTGHITFIGGKTYDSNGWSTQYGITTLHHGNFNFTTAKVPVRDSNGNSVSVTLGALVGVKQYNGGGYGVVIDP